MGCVIHRLLISFYEEAITAEAKEIAFFRSDWSVIKHDDLSVTLAPRMLGHKDASNIHLLRAAINASYQINAFLKMEALIFQDFDNFGRNL